VVRLDVPKAEFPVFPFKCEPTHLTNVPMDFLRKTCKLGIAFYSKVKSQSALLLNSSIGQVLLPLLGDGVPRRVEFLRAAKDRGKGV